MELLIYLPALVAVTIAILGVVTAVFALVMSARWFWHFVYDIRNQRYALASASFFIFVMMLGISIGIIGTGVSLLPIE